MNQKLIIALIILFICSSISAYVYASNTIITPTDISTTNVNTVNLDVSGTCTGCGGGGAGNFASYSIVLNQTIAGTGGNPVWNVKVGNDGTTTGEDTTKNFAVAPNGTVILVTDVGTNNQNTKQVDQTPDGKYVVIADRNTRLMSIYKNHNLLQSFTVDASWASSNLSTVSVAISDDGKYIALMGQNQVGSDSVQLYQGN